MRSGKVEPAARTKRKSRKPLPSGGAASPSGKKTASQFRSSSTGSSRRS
jgi:hypothetical protein